MRYRRIAPPFSVRTERTQSLLTTKCTSATAGDAPWILVAVVFACAFSTVATVAAASATAVDQCGQTINGSAELVRDLDCTGISPALTIQRGTLNLNGFSITGDKIDCDGSCKLIGPGNLYVDVMARKSLFAKQLTGAGILRSYDRTVNVDGCTITNGLVYADRAARVVDSLLSGTCVRVRDEHAGAKIMNTTIQDCPGTGVATTNAVVIDSVIVHNTGSGVSAYENLYPYYRRIGKARVINSTIAENGSYGIHGGELVSVTNSSIVDNGGVGVWAFRYWTSDYNPNPIGGIKVTQSTISGNLKGIYANKVRVQDSLVINNTVRGVEANALTVRGASLLQRNATGDGCGTTDVCVDVATTTKPYGANPSNCDTSRRLESLPGSPLTIETWGVCLLDQ